MVAVGLFVLDLGKDFGHKGGFLDRIVEGGIAHAVEFLAHNAPQQLL
jgi:hypothetical protein